MSTIVHLREGRRDTGGEAPQLSFIVASTEDGVIYQSAVFGIGQGQARAELGKAATIFREVDFAAREHEHAAAQVSILFKGASARLRWQSATGKTTSTVVDPQSFAYIAPGQLHRTHWSGQGELLNLYFSEDWLRELAEQVGGAFPSLKPLYLPDQSVYEIGRLLMDEFGWSGALQGSMVDHATTLIGHRILRVAGRLSANRAAGLLTKERLQPAMDYINANVESEFSLTDLARLCNTSVFHFARSFSARFGHPPFRLQRKLRLEKARELLLRTELSVEAIGFAVGYENPTHFSRLFRRQTGRTPTELRRLHEQ